ncbi:DUF6357 family protein [Lentzea cavernae]|uniref:Uncharacterized protein n=1 Tax=Lentzea cavernae TaxID=2020703 RepID=A0ABQ3M5U4_9PSEU|nr:DUF6357 family protein [Lentzea cavernae]GHH27707.1 hypothetical protein GCM10017774_00690 [Lentzea cavernae]
MSEVVFSRENVWIPRVVRADGELRLRLGAGADANHDPRTFTFPISEAHFAVISEDLTRHLLLWSAVLPLCEAAGTRGPLDERAAVALLDPVLLGTPEDVESLFRTVPWDRRQLIAQGADIGLLERGEIFAALRSATTKSDWHRVQRHDADRDRARRGVQLSPLDAALLEYTGRYVHGGKRPAREPGAVDPALLPEVMRVVATAEQACAGLDLSPGWRQVEKTVEDAVRRAYPDLVDDAVRTVSFLMCSEAAARARTA